MSHNEAVFALGALAQDTRLMVFRHLVQAGAAGAAAGEIARALSVPHNTLSTHLAQLSRANLLDAQKEGRSVIYRVRQSGAKALLSYLLEDCCQGNRAKCCEALDSTLTNCC